MDRERVAEVPQITSLAIRRHRHIFGGRSRPKLIAQNIPGVGVILAIQGNFRLVPSSAVFAFFLCHPHDTPKHTVKYMLTAIIAQTHYPITRLRGGADHIAQLANGLIELNPRSVVAAQYQQIFAPI